MADYKITASMLNSFQWYLDHQSNNDDAEIQKLLDTINRVSVEYTEAQARGKCFEEVINKYLTSAEVSKLIKATNEIQVNFDCNEQHFNFVFDKKLILKILNYLEEQGVYLQQHYINKEIKVDNTNIELYGYIDYLTPTTIIDLKTTKSYSFPKYFNNWQKHIYSYCLINEVEQMQFLATDFEEMFIENYNTDTIDYAELRRMLMHFIIWIEAYREQITDKKIFGGDNEPTPRVEPIITINAMGDN